MDLTKSTVNEILIFTPDQIINHFITIQMLPPLFHLNTPQIDKRGQIFKKIHLMGAILNSNFQDVNQRVHE